MKYTKFKTRDMYVLTICTVGMKKANLTTTDEDNMIKKE